MKILNVPSEYRDVVIDGMPVIPPVLNLHGCTTQWRGVSCGVEQVEEPESRRRNWNLTRDASRRRATPNGWVTKVISVGLGKLESGEWLAKCCGGSNPKERWHLRQCDNWRGICLLDVVGNILARVVKERLQVTAEMILPNSQCGFRSTLDGEGQLCLCRPS